MNGWVGHGCWLDWAKFPRRELNPDMVTQTSTNRARRRVRNFVDLTNVATNYAKPPPLRVGLCYLSMISY